MEIIVTMPMLYPPLSVGRLLHIEKKENDHVEIGDKLFSYEADGALMHEYAAFTGTLKLIISAEGELLRSGEAVMLINSEQL